MRGYDDLKRILELWEQGTPKERISTTTGIPQWTVRDCISRYGSVARLDAAMEGKPIVSYEHEEKKQRTYTISGYTPGRSRYTDSQLIEAVAESTSIAQVLQKFGLKPAGGNYAIIKKRISGLGLDTSHFKDNRDWAKGRKSSFVRKRSLEEILVRDSFYTTSQLRKRLINEGIFEHRCVSCGLDTWLDTKIPLEIDHINGDRRDNRLDNLRLLCPNCHALTATYRGKNKGQTGS